MGNFYAISNLAVALFIQLLGAYVFLQNPKARINKIFVIFCFVFSAWMYSLFFLYFFGTNFNSAIFWSKSVYVGACFSSVLSYHFIIAFLNITKRKWLLYFFYALSVIALFLVYNGGLLNGLYHYSWGYYPKFGKYHPVFMVYMISEFIYTTYLLYSKCNDKSLTTQEFQRIKYVLIAWIAGHLAVINFLPTYGMAILPVGNFFMGTLIFLLSYAIVRHQLMDIEVIIKKTLVFAGLLASVFAMLILPTLVIQEYIFRAASFAGKMLGLAISGTIIILTMRRIETFLINVTDKYLFQKKYDYKELLKTFTSEVLTVLELDKLVDLTVNKLSEIIKLTSAAVLLFNDDEQQFKVMSSRGIKDPEVTLIRPDGIVTFMEETHGYILIKELRQKKIAIPASIEEIIEKLNAELIIPMVMHDEVIGVLSLGKKKSDEDYSQDDLDILLPLARTLAIAISNAQLFDELGKTQAEAAQKEKMAVIGTLSAGINHEICNPLGIARGQCEAFLLNIKDGLYKNKSTEELLTKAKDIMAKVMHETDRATAITKKLSSFAKPSKGESEMVHIDKEIDDVLGLVGYELKLEKIEIEKRVQEGLPDIFVDKKQFQEVLFNLIRNAGQAIGEKGRIVITAAKEKEKIIIDIKDTGSGIPEDKIKMLFNPFFTTKDPGKGTGLGLFIVRQVVEKNGGRIYLKETKVGEGTTFTLEFPVVIGEKVKAKQ